MATAVQKFGARIKKIRKAKGMTQEQLTEKARIDFSFMNRIESGKKNPSLKTIAKLARALGVKLSELFNF